VSGLTKSITESNPVVIPQGPTDAWKGRYARCWVDLCDPDNSRRRPEDQYQTLFVKSSSQFILARYIISHATEDQSPDVDFVGPVVCDCFNVALLVVEVSSLERPPAKVFSPSKHKFASRDWAKDTRMCIHLLKDMMYWDHLSEDKGGTITVPKHVIHKLTEEDLFDEDQANRSPESFRMEKGCVYQVRVYDANLRRNLKVGDMVAPKSPQRVHYLEVDCSNVKDHWIFNLWKPSMSKPGVQLARKPVWIFARIDNIARCISVWKKDITGPRFLMDKKETVIYTVEAECEEEAAACVSNQFKINVKTTR
jgi:hypothetical protein